MMTLPYHRDMVEMIVQLDLYIPQNSELHIYSPMSIEEAERR